jgi:hypothetical protein
MKLHLLFAAALAVFSVQTTFGSSFNIKPFSDVTAETPNIVRGTIARVHVENAITEDGGKTIFTYADVIVKEVLKGKIAGSSIVVRKVGGTKDGVTLEIPSSPEFVENEEVVLFLSEEQSDQTYEVLGLELGKFNLEPKNGDIFLTGGLFSYAERDDHDHPTTAQSENQKSWSVGQLRDLIKKQQSTTSAPVAVVATREVSTPDLSKPNPLKEPAPSPHRDEPSAPNDESSRYRYHLVIAVFAIAAILFFKKRS